MAILVLNVTITKPACHGWPPQCHDCHWHVQEERSAPAPLLSFMYMHTCVWWALCVQPPVALRSPPEHLCSADGFSSSESRYSGFSLWEKTMTTVSLLPSSLSVSLSPSLCLSLLACLYLSLFPSLLLSQSLSLSPLFSISPFSLSEHWQCSGPRPIPPAWAACGRFVRKKSCLQSTLKSWIQKAFLWRSRRIPNKADVKWQINK